MRSIVRFGAIALALAVMAAGCAAPPSADIDAAKAAVDKAVTGGAGQYAADALKAAEEARAALDAELKAQEGKWFKSVRQGQGTRGRGEGGRRQGGRRCRRGQGEG